MLGLLRIIEPNKLCLAVKRKDGDITEIARLLDSGIDIHEHDDLAIRNACEYGCVENVRALVERGANIHVKDETPLFLACVSSNYKSVVYLIRAGADINKMDEDYLGMALTSIRSVSVLRFVLQGLKKVPKIDENDGIQETLNAVFSEIEKEAFFSVFSALDQRYETEFLYDSRIWIVIRRFLF